MLTDYHIHSRWSPDARISMADMAQAGIDAGLGELCFTDHVEIMNSKSMQRNIFDWAAWQREYAAAQSAVGHRITLRRGFELGEAPRDFAYAEELLAQMPPVDFIISSIHQLSGKYGHEDLAYASTGDPVLSHAQIADYLELVLSMAKWGKFSVLGHLTLPLRYMNERNGGHMTFDGFEEEVTQIFRALIENGCGIEVNTNRGNTPLPGEKWLRLYRACGGEILTIGSDAHTPEYVGCCVRERQELLRACGFTHICTFQDLQPIFQPL